jgi:hypothetical protein
MKPKTYSQIFGIDIEDEEDVELNEHDMYGSFPPYLSPGNIPETLAEQWKSEGKCPKCGKDGVFSHFQYVCLKHGSY